MNDVEAMKIYHLLGKIETSINEIRYQITQSINGNIKWQPTPPCSAHDQETALRELVALSEEMGLYDEINATLSCTEGAQLQFDFMNESSPGCFMNEASPPSFFMNDPFDSPLPPGTPLYAPIDTELVKQWGYDIPKVEDDSSDT